MNRLDETASLNGLGFDADPGVSWWVAGVPGILGVACWPFSDHSKEPPATTPLTVHDPEHWYVSGELECTDDDDGSALHLHLHLHLLPTSEGKQAASITVVEARLLIGGLLPDDDVALTGFISDVHHSVVVIRDDRRIASVGFAFVDGRWAQRGGHVCGGVTYTS